jgi:hypothetical protein
MAYPHMALMFPVLHFAIPDDEDTAGPSGHAPAPALMIVSERYLAALEFRIQTAAKTLSLLQKRFNNRKDDPIAAAEVKTYVDAARNHLHELEGRLDTCMLETSPSRPDEEDRHITRQRHAPSRASRKHSTDGSDDEEDDTHGHACPRALPRPLPVPRDGYLDKSGKINRIRKDYLNSLPLLYWTLWVIYESLVRDDSDQNEAISMSSIVKLKTLRDASGSAITLARLSARRRSSGGAPGGGCARKPVGTYLYLHAVGAGNPVAVPCLAR